MSFMQNKSQVITSRKMLYVSAVILCMFTIVGVHDAEAKKLKSKTYKKDYTINKGDVLEGVGSNKTTIKGNIRVRGDGTLRNLEIDGGSIFVLSGVNLVIENVVIDDAPGTAIETRGGGTLTVRNSAIIDSKGKAFYIQRGKHIIITGTTVRGSGEEGIDIRSGVSGIISGNTIINNKESGIEVILGNAALKITNNTLNNNGSSGIASQYYTSSDNLGVVAITDNILIGNRSYGLTCKTPSGGHPGDTYWRDSMRLEDNKISGNKLGGIAKRCDVQNINSAAVRAAAQKARIKAEEEAARKAEEERRRKEIEEQRRILTNSEMLLVQELEKLQSDKDNLEKQSWASAFFSGINDESIAKIYERRVALAQIDDTIRGLHDQELDDMERGRVDVISGRISVIQGPLDAYISEKEQRGLWKKVTYFFKSV